MVEPGNGYDGLGIVVGQEGVRVEEEQDPEEDDHRLKRCLPLWK